jgi:Arc/MetJ family transcription regulator
MTTVQIRLPDELAQMAQKAGLLSPERLEPWLRAQLKSRQTDELFDAMARMAACPDPAVLSPEDMAAEISQMRAELRAGPKA